MTILDKLKVISWNVGFIDNGVEELIRGGGYQISWMKHPYHDRFFADPFMLSQDEETVTILAEEYFFIEKKGRIVKLLVDKGTKELKARSVLIDTKYHLSYPFLYGNFIIPEQSESGKWIQYNLDGQEVQVLANVGFIDATIFREGSNEWLFATKHGVAKGEAIKKLYRYKMKNGVPILASEKLIKDDLKASRPGGSFFRCGDAWYRVGQTSTENIYGVSVAICRVLACEDRCYEEELVREIDSSGEKRYTRGLHTLNVCDGMIIVDGCELQFHPILKVIDKLEQIIQRGRRK